MATNANRNATNEEGQGASLLGVEDAVTRYNEIREEYETWSARHITEVDVAVLGQLENLDLGDLKRELGETSEISCYYSSLTGRIASETLLAKKYKDNVVLAVKDELKHLSKDQIALHPAVAIADDRLTLALMKSEVTAANKRVAGEKYKALSRLVAIREAELEKFHRTSYVDDKKWGPPERRGDVVARGVIQKTPRIREKEPLGSLVELEEELDSIQFDDLGDLEEIQCTTPKEPKTRRRGRS